MSGEALTGGQLCVRGIVQQALSGLAHSTTVILDQARFEGADLGAAQLTLEPKAGGDHQSKIGDTRVVEQVKIRTNGKPWTAGDIAGKVLPDLLLAVQDDGKKTRYRFATDGDLNCDDLIAFCARLSEREVPADPLAALDDTDKKAFKYQAWKSERGYFEAIANRIGGTDYKRIWRLLAALEVEGGLSEAKLIEQIDGFLTDVVDAIEEVPHKRPAGPRRRPCP